MQGRKAPGKPWPGDSGSSAVVAVVAVEIWEGGTEGVASGSLVLAVQDGVAPIVGQGGIVAWLLAPSFVCRPRDL